jgi:hypothetical protein
MDDSLMVNPAKQLLSNLRANCINQTLGSMSIISLSGKAQSVKNTELYEVRAGFSIISGWHQRGEYL